MYDELIENSIDAAELFYNGELTEDELYSLLYQGVIDEEALSEAFDYIEEGRNQNNIGYRLYDIMSGNRSSSPGHENYRRANLKGGLIPDGDGHTTYSIVNSLNPNLRDRIFRGAFKNNNNVNIRNAATKMRQDYVDGVRSGASKEWLKDKLNQYKGKLKQLDSGISDYTVHHPGGNEHHAEWVAKVGLNSRNKFFKKYPPKR